MSKWLYIMVCYAESVVVNHVCYAEQVDVSHGEFSQSVVVNNLYCLLRKLL